MLERNLVAKANRLLESGRRFCLENAGCEIRYRDLPVPVAEIDWDIFPTPLGYHKETLKPLGNLQLRSNEEWYEDVQVNKRFLFLRQSQIKTVTHPKKYEFLLTVTSEDESLAHLSWSRLLILERDLSRLDNFMHVSGEKKGLERPHFTSQIYDEFNKIVDAATAYKEKLSKNFNIQT